jgi:hypothetical protein
MRQFIGNSKAQDLKLQKKTDDFVIVENERGEILLQKRLDRELWGLPGGVNELRMEPGLHLVQLSLYRMFPNDMAIYMAKSYFGYLNTKEL